MKRLAVVSIITLSVAACHDAREPLAPTADGVPVQVAASAAGGRIPGQYIVVLKDDARDVPGLARALAAAHGGSVRFVWEHALKGFSLNLSEQGAAALARNPNVAWVEPNQVAHGVATQSNPTWGLDRIDQRNLPLDASYTYPNTGSGVRAYVLDSGIRFSHNEFGGRATSGYDYIDNDSDASDCHPHGTHVAGTLGGATYGVAKGVSIISVRVLDCNNSGSYDAIISGVNWVTANAVEPAVANMSISGPGSSALDAAVANSISSGVVYAVAAGNGTNNNGIPADACTFSPARVSQALTVGATDQSDNEGSFSNYGTCLDLLAPGVSVTSAWNGSDTDTRAINGTSMATPHVAGVAALYLAWKPTSTPSQVASALTSNASTGKITLNAASASAGTPNKLLFSRFVAFTAAITGPTQLGHGTSCTWNAAPGNGVAPFTYAWGGVPSTPSTVMTLSNATSAAMTGTGYYYGSIYQTGSVNVYLTITDAAGTVATASRPVSIISSFSGCY